MSWDESKHPRVKAGDSAGGQFISAARQGAGLPLQNIRNKEAASDSLSSFESLIRGQNYESAAVYNRFGDPVFWKDGEESKVVFDSYECSKMFGCTMTHNHPSGRPFSEDDIFMFEINGLMEIRAVTKDNGTFVLKRTFEQLREVWSTKNDIDIMADFMKFNQGACRIAALQLKAGKFTEEDAVPKWTAYWKAYAALRHYTFEIEKE